MSDGGEDKPTAAAGGDRPAEGSDANSAGDGVRPSPDGPPGGAPARAATAKAEFSAGAGGPPPKATFTVPAPPRWRFVNEAKKTAGYSSVAAGTVVEGLSASELAGKYVVPEWQVEEENVEPVMAPAGRMGGDPTREEKEPRKVGRLNMPEKVDEVEEAFSGTFAGFRNRADETSEDESAAKESIDELDTLQGETLEPPSVAPPEGQAEWGAAEEAADPRPGPEVSVAKDAGAALDLENQEEAAAPAENGPAEEDKPPEAEEGPPNRKRKNLLLLVLAALVALAAVAGVLLAGGELEDENDADGAVGGAADLGDERNRTDVPSSSPSSAAAFSPYYVPIVSTVAPTEDLPVCPAGAKLLTVQHYSDAIGSVGGGGPPKNHTSAWVVRDACTGEEAARCRPCQGHGPEVDGRCLGPTDQPRVSRDRDRFRFNLLGADARCVDRRGALYEWGQFDNVDNFNDCAYACVKDTPKELVRRDAFRGYDYECSSQLCRCLYDEGTLDERNSAGFDATSNDGEGRDFDESSGGAGEIAAIASGNAGYHCAKLVCHDQDCGEGGANHPMYSLAEYTDGQRLPFEDEHCLPSGKSYVFEVEPSDDAGACCGFDPHSFVVSYDDILVGQGKPGTSTFNDGGLSNTNQSSGGKSYFGQRVGVCPSSNPSSVPSIAPSSNAANPSSASSIAPSQAGAVPSTPSPLPPVRDIPIDAGVPCREVIESELAGRINGVSRPFCGLCEWKNSGFNCYQRIIFLKNKYGTGQVEAREGLLNQGHCSVPANTEANESLNTFLQREIEKITYCGNVEEVRA